MLCEMNSPCGSRTAKGQLCRKGMNAARTSLGRRAVHLLQSQPEQQIEHRLVFLDRIIGHFGQFVVPEQEMHLVRDT